MRELAVRLKFTKDCLGNVKQYVTNANTGRKWPVFLLPRMPDGRIRFESNWWRASLRFAAEVLCKHHKAIDKVHFDLAVDGEPDPVTGYYKRYFDSHRYVRHEAFTVGDTITVNCIVPSEINDEDFGKLMELVGRFKGISPFGPREFGFFAVESVTKRISNNENKDLPGRSVVENSTDKQPVANDTDQPVEVHAAPVSCNESGTGCSE